MTTLLFIGPVVGATVFVLTLDGNRYKGLLESAVMDATGRKLVIRGDVAIAPSLKPELTVTNLALANAPWGSRPGMLHIARLRAGLALLPLLRRQIHITRIQLIDTDLLLETGADGRANWQFDHTLDPSAGLGMRGPSVGQIEVEGLAVTWRAGSADTPAAHYHLDRLDWARPGAGEAPLLTLQGHANGQALVLSGQTGPLGDLFRGAPLPFTLSGTAAGGTVGLHGQLRGAALPEDLYLSLRVSGGNLATLGTAIAERLPETHDYALEAHLSGSGEALSARELSGHLGLGGVTLAVQGGIRDLLALEGIELALKGSGSDLSELGPMFGERLPRSGPFELSGRLSGTARALALSEARATLGLQGIQISLAGGVGDLLALQAVDASVTGSGNTLGDLGRLVGVALPDTGPFTATGQLTGSARALALHGLRASVRQGSAQLLLSGGVGDLLRMDGIALRIVASGKDLGALGALLDMPLPELGPFRAQGRLSGSAELLDLRDFSATIDRSDLTGWVEVVPGTRPRVTARLSSGLIDFTRIIQQLQGQTAAPQDGGSRSARGLFSNAPLPLDGLQAVDADLALSARNLKAREAELEFAQLTLRLEGGDLDVERLEATYRGSKVSAKLQLRADAAPSVALKFLVQGFDLGRFLKETQVSQEVDAQLDLAAELSSRGNSPQRLVANLEGIVGAVVGKGQVPRYLDLLAEDLTRRVTAFWGRHKGAGQLNCGMVQFAIKGGMATSDAFLFDTRLGILKGDGEIDLATEQLDFVLSPKPKKASLFSLATKLHISGSMRDPRVRPQTKALAKKGAKALSALVIGPAGLLVPFINTGARHRHVCDIQALETRVQRIYD